MKIEKIERTIHVAEKMPGWIKFSWRFLGLAFLLMILSMLRIGFYKVSITAPKAEALEISKAQTKINIVRYSKSDLILFDVNDVDVNDFAEISELRKKLNASIDSFIVKKGKEIELAKERDDYANHETLLDSKLAPAVFTMFCFSALAMLSILVVYGVYRLRDDLMTKICDHNYSGYTWEKRLGIVRSLSGRLYLSNHILREVVLTLAEKLVFVEKKASLDIFFEKDILAFIHFRAWRFLLINYTLTDEDIERLLGCEYEVARKRAEELRGKV